MMSILFRFLIFMNSVINQPERYTFIDGDENKVYDQHERKQDAEAQRHFLELHVHEIKYNVIGFKDGERHEDVQENVLRNGRERNADFKNRNPQEYPEHFPDHLCI